MPQTDWESLAAGLAASIPWLEAGSLVVIEEDAPGKRLAQFAHEGDSLSFYVVSSRFLAEEFRLSSEGEQVLVEAGWNRPGTSGEEQWWWSTSWPVTSAVAYQVAEMIVVALRDGYGVADPRVLTYRAWNERKYNENIELPKLGIPFRE